MATGRVQSSGFAEVNAEAAVFHALATELKVNSSVSDLRFRRCRLAAAVAFIGYGLRGNQTIQSITLEQCGLINEHLAAFLAALSDCTSLQKLSLEGNLCREFEMNGAASLLGNKTLHNLSRHNQRIEGEESLDISPLANALVEDNSSLRFLDLSRNSLGGDDVALLAPSLLDNTKLETLHLDQNLISDRGASVLAEALPSFQVMKTLSLPENPFGEEGASAILSGMEDCDII
jgi:hypothetical protein